MLLGPINFPKYIILTTPGIIKLLMSRRMWLNGQLEINIAHSSAIAKVMHILLNSQKHLTAQTWAYGSGASNDSNWFVCMKHETS